MSFSDGNYKSDLEGKGIEDSPAKQVTFDEEGQVGGITEGQRDASAAFSSSHVTTTSNQGQKQGKEVDNSPSNSYYSANPSPRPPSDAEGNFDGTPSRSFSSQESGEIRTQAGDGSIGSILDHGSSPNDSTRSPADGLSGESSFEVVQGQEEAAEEGSPSRVGSTWTSSIQSRPSFSSLVSQPNLNATNAITSKGGLEYEAHSQLGPELATTTPKSNRTRTSSAIIPRRPPPKTSLLTPSEASGFPTSHTAFQRRASHEGVIHGEGSPKVVAPLDHEPSPPRPSTHHQYLEISSPGGSTHLNPFASNFEPPTPVFISSHFPGKAAPKYLTFEWISRNGKNSLGDYSKEARIALKSIGLNSIPSLHGPLSLPYARCPSGIDAFLFSAEKDEDPWTFVLETENRPGRPPLPSVRNVPLPGNSRYSHPLNVAKGRIPARVVSAPAAVESDGDTVFDDSVSSRHVPHRNESRTSRHRQSGSEAFTQAETEYSNSVTDPLRAALASAVPPYPHPHPVPAAATHARQYSIPGLSSPYGATDYTHLLPNPYSYPYGWGSPIQTQHYASPNVFSSFNIPPPVFAQPQQPVYPNVMNQGHQHQPQGTFHDPAIVSYGDGQQQYQPPYPYESTSAGHSSYHTAVGQGRDDGDTTDEEFSNGGFFFPAVRPGDQSRQRRAQHHHGRSDSVDSESTVGGLSGNKMGASRATGGATRSEAARPPSQPPLHPLVPSSPPERRSSAAPTTPNRFRRPSTTSAVTVSPRRSASLAPQPRLVFDMPAPATQKESAAGAKASRQPRPPPTSPPTTTSFPIPPTTIATTRPAVIGSQLQSQPQPQQANPKSSISSLTQASGPATSKFLVRRPSASTTSSSSVLSSGNTSLEPAPTSSAASEGGWGSIEPRPAAARGRGGKRGRGGARCGGHARGGSAGGGSESSSQTNSVGPK